MKWNGRIIDVESCQKVAKLNKSAKAATLLLKENNAHRLVQRTLAAAAVYVPLLEPSRVS